MTVIGALYGLSVILVFRRLKVAMTRVKLAMGILGVLERDLFCSGSRILHPAVVTGLFRTGRWLGDSKRPRSMWKRKINDGLIFAW